MLAIVWDFDPVFFTIPQMLDWNIDFNLLSGILFAALLCRVVYNAFRIFNNPAAGRKPSGRKGVAAGDGSAKPEITDGLFSIFATGLIAMGLLWVVTDRIEIRYYGVTWAVMLLFGGVIFAYFCKREGQSQELADSAFIYIALGTVLGARIGHCLFYDPMYYLPQPWTIFTEIRDGGMASHGATIGIMLSIWLCARKNRVSTLWLMDRLVVIAAICGAMIRFANLLNSEIVGRATDLPWGFKFMRLHPNLPAELVPAQHPTQIYEMICYLLTFAFLWLLYKRTSVPQRRGLLFGAGLIGIFLTRFIIEFIKVEQVDFERGMILNMGQCLSIPFIIVGVAMILYALHRPPVDNPAAQAAAPEAAQCEKSAPKPKHVRKFNKKR